MRFKEIEHKFVVDGGFDQAGFRAVLETLGPAQHSSLLVRDRYFLTGDGRARHYIVRHRYDRELHQLTLKSLASDPEVRDEIDLELGHHHGDQAAQVDAFLGRMGVVWSGELQKELDVWYFADCEVVHYVAASGDRVVRCVEFEAVGAASVAEGLAVIERYERAAGFDPATRSRQSLVDLLFPGVVG